MSFKNIPTEPNDEVQERQVRVGGLVPSLSNRIRRPLRAARLPEGGSPHRRPYLHGIIVWTVRNIRRYRLHYYASIGLSILFVLQIVVFSANLFRSGQPILGLRFNGHDVSNYDRAKLVEITNRAIQQVESSPLAVQADNSQTKLTARQLGARYSTNSIIAGIYSAGRIGSPFDQLVVEDAAILGIYSFRLGFPNINATLTKDYLATVNDAIKLPPTNAGLAFKDNKVVVVPGRPGHELDIDGSLEALKNYDPSLDMRLIKLPLKQIQPVIGERDVSGLLPEVSRITDKPLLVRAGALRAEVSRSALTNLLVIESVPDPRHPTKNKPSIVIDQPDADRISAQLARQFDHDAKPKIIAGTAVVSAGQDGDVLDGTQTKIALIAQILLRQQLVIDGSKPLNLAVHHVKAPVLPKNSDPNYYGGRIAAYSGSSPRVTLTFEGMPNATYGPQILDILKRNNIHAVFFAVGRNAVSYPDVVQRMASEGHIVGVSTYSYRDVGDIPDSDLKDEIIGSQSVISKITGQGPMIFRSPYGTNTPQADNVLQQANMMSLGWTLDAFDWGSLPVGFIVSRVVSSVQPGSIIKLHALNNQTIVALPQIITGLKNKGYVFN